MEAVTFLITFAMISAIVYWYNRTNKKVYMSFKEAMDLTELPVVTFYNGRRKLNFLLDTGSNNSIINAPVVNKLNCNLREDNISTFGMTGEEVKSSTCEIELKYKDEVFAGTFVIIDMSEAFDKVKRESGVTIHGILGSKFFQKYKYVLDFSTLAVYLKKK